MNNPESPIISKPRASRRLSRRVFVAGLLAAAAHGSEAFADPLSPVQIPRPTTEPTSPQADLPCTVGRTAEIRGDLGEAPPSPEVQKELIDQAHLMFNPLLLRETNCYATTKIFADNQANTFLRADGTSIQTQGGERYELGIKHVPTQQELKLFRYLKEGTLIAARAFINTPPSEQVLGQSYMDSAEAAAEHAGNYLMIAPDTTWLRRSIINGESEQADIEVWQGNNLSENSIVRVGEGFVSKEITP